jgi:hypothetical protein
MTSKTRLYSAEWSTHGLKHNCLSFGEALSQSFAVIAPTTIPASNLGLIVALAGNGAWLSFVLLQPDTSHCRQPLFIADVSDSDWDVSFSRQAV